MSQHGDLFEEPVDAVLAVHGTPAGPLSAERMEVRTALFRVRQALDKLTYIDRHTPGQADSEHDEMRFDLEQVERVLSRWDPGRR